MRPFEIKKDIYWVGVIDWNLRDFHGFATEKGTTYNAYLVRGGKNVLFDTVKAEFAGEFIRNIRTVIDPEKIDYMVCNHAEMDHTGALPAVIDAVKPEKIFCTKACKDALLAHFHREDWPFEVIKEGDTLDLGGKTVQFFGSAMIHWPDSMVSYIKEDHLLISNDIFGQHWATNERFDDQVDQGELAMQSAKYYANIFLPMSPAVRKFLEKLEKSGLSIEMIAPDHGLIWKDGIAAIMKSYGQWSRWETKPKAVIIYDTMWESTAKMARAVADGLSSDGISVRLYDLRLSHPSDIMTDVLDAKAILIGSSILNGGILPRMAGMLTYMKGLRPTNKIGAAFGSYGWSPVILKLLTEALAEMKIEILDPGISVQYVPTADDIARCTELGDKLRSAIIKA